MSLSLESMYLQYVTAPFAGITSVSLGCLVPSVLPSYSLTLIDALDTLAIMGNYSEFQRVATLLQSHLDFSEDINVSVFETNIRGEESAGDI